MSKTKVQVHYSEYVKQGIYAIIVIGIALFGIKSCRKFQQKRAVIVELSSCASESAAYEQFTPKMRVPIFISPCIKCILESS